MYLHKIVVSFILLLATQFILASKLPVESFSQLPSVQGFSLSPNGTKLVYIRNIQEKGVSLIVMIDIAKNEKRVLGITDNHGEHFRWLKWASDEIILGSVIVKTHRKTFNLQETRLYKFYADGSGKSQSVYSPRIFKLSRRQWNPYIQDKVIDWLPDDVNHVLVQMNIHNKNFPSVFKLNVNDGSVETIKRANNEINYWITDQQHNVRTGIAVNYKYKSVKIWSDNLQNNEWSLLWEYEIGSINTIHPKGFDLNSNIFYFTKYHNDKLALFSIALDTKKETLIFSDPKYDVRGDLIFSHKTNGVVGFYHDESPSGRYYLDPLYQEEQKKIDKLLPDTRNVLLSESDDLDTYIVYADAENIPGTYYIGKKQQQSLNKLFSQYPNLNSTQMVGSKKISYITRDGLEIEAYLSIPKGIDKPVATVIHPHGGPGSRDYGRFDIWTEFLVSRGFAVLRPNFRGSEGYGYKFAQAQEKSWGMEMQNDITDGVKWLVDNKIADPDKVCIFGASYGGYAALMGAIKTPDLFKCAISFAGVTDLVALRNKLRRSDRYQLSKDQLGDDDKIMSQSSPRFRVADIKIPVLLLHGDYDKVVDIEQGRWMAEELKKSKKEYKYVELADGNHFLSIQENRTTVFTEVGAFLEQYLK